MTFVGVIFLRPPGNNRQIWEGSCYFSGFSIRTKKQQNEWYMVDFARFTRPTCSDVSFFDAIHLIFTLHLHYKFC